jgi:tetratricopeptide (TPR) repeat protein
MSLQPGVRLGVFEILGPLGAGGMGEVYRARDSRLGREVALKVLPAAFSKDPLRVARFEREARMLAAINHPGIAAIYGAEETGDIPYIIMELVPGDTLAEEMARGPLPLDESLSAARQIADALEAAHTQGVVHRDLKPSNIKITPEGKIKVLDLGLAKATEMPGPGEGMSNSPTVTLEQTRPGTILGTVEFMSPEQARGKEVDKRTDIWAFGCILFEMLSGVRPFAAETISDVLAAILTREPDWRALPASTPARVRELLSRCLEKDANKRLRDIGDARIELETALGLAPDAGGAAKPSRARHRRALLVAALVALLAAGVWMGIQLLGRSMRARPPDSKYLVVLPFKDLSATPQGQLLGDGFVETVSARLNRVPGVQVVTPSASIAASDREKDAFQIARSVGANLVLRCTIQREASRVRITYSVLNASNGVQLTGGEVTGSASELFALQDELTERVASGLDLAARTHRTPVPSGLETAAEQERYIEALGLLQRYDKVASVGEATRILAQLATDRPEVALVHAALARAYLYKFHATRERSWADQAMATADKARILNSDLPEVHAALGEVYLRTGQLSQATAEFERALRVQPNNFQAVIGLANAYDVLRRDGLAEATYRRAIALQPGYFGGYSKLAGFFFTRGDYQKAADMFRQVTVLAPDNADAQSNLGGAYELLGNLDGALIAYHKSIAIAPTAAAYGNLGTLEYFLGEFEASRDHFEKAVQLAPNDFNFWAQLGDAYRWLPRVKTRATDAYARSIQLAAVELNLNPQNAFVHSKLAICLAKTGRREEALKQIQLATQIDPKNPDFMYDAAVVSVVVGKPQDALSWLRRAIAGGSGTSHIAREPEFAAIRREKAFEELLNPRSANPL